MFTAFPLPTPEARLGPTMSTYQFGLDLEGFPKAGNVYVICDDGSIQSRDHPDRPIGWQLIETTDGWMYRVTQMNHKPKPLAVSFYGWAEDIPKGRGYIGSVVVAARQQAEPQDAEVIEQKDQDEEVSSTPPSTPCQSPKCPGAPRKSDIDKIASIDPLLAQCAVMLGDPVQTEAMSKFAEGKMSYAEMRGLCG
jgi:hypothetical protein